MQLSNKNPDLYYLFGGYHQEYGLGGSDTSPSARRRLVVNELSGRGGCFSDIFQGILVTASDCDLDLSLH